MNKTNKFKALLSTFLVVTMLTCLISSCGGKKDEDTKDNDTAKTTDISGAAAEETTLPMFAGIEDKDYGGKDFHILARATQAYQFWVEGETGDLVNDAVYQRNKTVENKYNVNIKMITAKGDWDDRAQFLTSLRNSINAGDGAYDMVDGYAAYIGDLIAAKLFYNLLDVPHLRLNEVWWSQNAVNEMTVNGRLYAVPGDISVNLWENIMVMYFNQKLLTDNGLESPYTLVRNNEWTIEKMEEMIKGVKNDVNGDNLYDENDQFGIVFADDLQFNNFHNAYNLPLTTRDADGFPSLALGTEQITNIVTKVMDLVYKNPDTIFLKEGGTKAEKMFGENRILFMPTLLQSAAALRVMEDSFGIIPYPKGDASVKEYRTTSRDGHSMFCIPTDVKDVEFCGRIMEALCVASNKIVIPAYYEKSLKIKYARDTDTVEMLDLIRRGLNFDFAVVFAIQTERAGFLIRDVVNNQWNLASEYEKSKSKFEKKFDSFLDSYRD